MMMMSFICSCRNKKYYCFKRKKSPPGFGPGLGLWKWVLGLGSQGSDDDYPFF